MVVEEAEEPLLHEGYQDGIMLSCHFDCGKVQYVSQDYRKYWEGDQTYAWVKNSDIEYDEHIEEGQFCVSISIALKTFPELILF